MSKGSVPYRAGQGALVPGHATHAPIWSSTVLPRQLTVSNLGWGFIHVQIKKHTDKRFFTSEYKNTENSESIQLLFHSWSSLNMCAFLSLQVWGSRFERPKVSHIGFFSLPWLPCAAYPVVPQMAKLPPMSRNDRPQEQTHCEPKHALIFTPHRKPLFFKEFKPRNLSSKLSYIQGSSIRKRQALSGLSESERTDLTVFYCCFWDPGIYNS